MKEFRFPTELKLWKYKIERLARRFGLDFYPIMYNIVTPEEMSEVVARHGFPSVPHHWRYGQSSISFKKRFRYGLGRIYEIVLNTEPAYAFLLEINDVITQKSVMAHVPGHVDMNKNNPYFRPTNRNMLNVMAADALLLERLFDLIGRDKVKEFYDMLLSFEWFIDQNAIYRSTKKENIQQERVRGRAEKLTPRRIEAHEDLPFFMDEFLNPPDWLEEESRRLVEKLQKEVDVERGAIIPPKPTKDILEFFLRHISLERWQRELIGMVWRQVRYFVPMVRTKLMHEGWATLWEEEIMTEAGFIGRDELTQFAKELAGVQRKGAGINPYRLGYELWHDIWLRWDTGRHGSIWETCTTRSVKDRWDEFSVFKTITDNFDYGTEMFSKYWSEFSAFVAELKLGNLGYPKEFFVRNIFTKKHLIPLWVRYCNFDKEYSKFNAMLKKMESLELQAKLLATKLKDRAVAEGTHVLEEELEIKARRDIYRNAGEGHLALWTPEEVRRELHELDKLDSFRKRFRAGEIQHASIIVDPEWITWASKFSVPLLLGKGIEKIFEVRSTCNDYTFLDEFFTKDFCEENQYFLYKAKQVWDPATYRPTRNYVIESRSFERIKRRLLFQYMNRHLPEIHVVNGNYNNGELLLRHEHNGVDLDYWSKDGMFIKDVLRNLFVIWGSQKAVHLETIKTKKNEEKPWWHYWHQTKETQTDEPEELHGTRVCMSWGPHKVDIKGNFGSYAKKEETGYYEQELGEVTFRAPF